MKKVLLTLALAAFAFAANAQFVIGGQIDVNHNGNATGDFGNTATTTFTFMPKVGYCLNDNMQIGLNFGMAYNYTRNYDGDNNNDHYFSNTGKMYLAAPYFRYNFAQWKNFKVFCEAQLALAMIPKNSWNNNTLGTSGEGNTKTTAINFNVVPGLNYAITDHISLDVYVNLLGLYYNYVTTTTTIAGTDIVDKTHDYGFMANMSAETINNHFNNFTIGFNYAF